MYADPGLARGGVLTADGAKTAAATFFRNGDVSRLADVDALKLVHVETAGSTPKYYVFNAIDGEDSSSCRQMTRWSL